MPKNRTITRNSNPTPVKFKMYHEGTKVNDHPNSFDVEYVDDDGQIHRVYIEKKDVSSDVIEGPGRVPFIIKFLLTVLLIFTLYVIYLCILQNHLFDNLSIPSGSYG